MQDCFECTVGGTSALAEKSTSYDKASNCTSSAEVWFMKFVACTVCPRGSARAGLGPLASQLYWNTSG
eukprot:6198422-Karenia_brevis.AAC.1